MRSPASGTVHAEADDEAPLLATTTPESVPLRSPLLAQVALTSPTTEPGAVPALPAPPVPPPALQQLPGAEPSAPRPSVLARQGGTLEDTSIFGAPGDQVSGSSGGDAPGSGDGNSGGGGDTAAAQTPAREGACNPCDKCGRPVPNVCSDTAAPDDCQCPRCAICFERLDPDNNGEQVTTLPCYHVSSRTAAV